MTVVRRVVAMAFVAATLAGSAPGATAAATRLHTVRVGTIDGPLMSDGRRYAVWVQAGRVRLADAKTGRTRSVTAPCPSGSGADAPAGLGAGRLLWYCTDGPVVLRISDGTAALVPPPPLGSDARYDGGWTQVGRHWLGGGPSVLYLDWHTGAMVADTFGPRRNIDLDAPSLVHRLCPPLRRPRNRFRRYVSLDYAPPYAIGVGARNELLLRRCGTRRAVVLDRYGGAGVQLTRRIVSWVEFGDVKAYFPASGRRARAHQHNDDDVIRDVVHTRRAVYFTSERAGVDRLTLWRASIPRGLTRGRTG